MEKNTTGMQRKKGSVNRRKRARSAKRQGFVEKRRYKPFLHPLIMGNMRSLGNKRDKLKVIESESEFFF